MRSREWERRTILLFLLALVADDRRPVTLALPLSASLLGRAIAFHFPKQRRERLANKNSAGSGD